jgi:hypothetical protein
VSGGSAGDRNRPAPSVTTVTVRWRDEVMVTVTPGRAPSEPSLIRPVNRLCCSCASTGGANRPKTAARANILKMANMVYPALHIGR